MEMLADWKERMLQKAPRLSLESKFRFACHKGLSCFGKCCGGVNIFLTPYDVLRMKRALNISSGEFLGKYTIPLFLEAQKFPVVVLKMNDDERKTCPMVTPSGCLVYEDRPWSCRMYPIGATPPRTGEGAEEYYLVAEEGKPCLGLKEAREWTVEEWLIDQGVDTYNKKSQPYMEITLQKCFLEGKGLDSAKTQMLYVTCYDIDRFRKNLFDSTFFDRFDVEPEVIEKIKTDDEELLDFGARWLKFSLFGENTISIKGEVLEGKKKG
jgi:Fe-S-cluster containining protein